MWLVTKLRELRLGLAAGVVTLPYPASPRPAPPAFRGRPRFDPERCIGCGGCASNCPAREILVCDPSQEVRILESSGLRCTCCGRCAELCPEGAITLSREYETATADPALLRERLTLAMGTCQRCGRCFAPASPLARLKLTGYREDDLARGRWVFRARPWLGTGPEVDDVPIDLPPDPAAGAGEG